MKTVQDYLDLGVEFAKGDVVIGYKNIEYSKNWHESLQDDDSDEGDIWLDCNIKSFVWRNNDGVNPEYNGLIEVECGSGRIQKGSSRDFMYWWDDGTIIKWRPVVLQSESPTASPKEDKPMKPFEVDQSCREPKAIFNTESTMFGDRLRLKAEDFEKVDFDMSIITGKPMKKFKANQEANEIVAAHIESMRPVYTAEMHSKGELPPVGADCILIIDSEPRQARVTYIGKSLGVCSNIDGGAEYAFLLGKASFKPIIKTIKVNGFDVPAPMSEAPEHKQMVYLAHAAHLDFNLDFTWQGDDATASWLSRGLIHSTKSAAIAHAKAMLGIDPNA